MTYRNPYLPTYGHGIGDVITIPPPTDVPTSGLWAPTPILPDSMLPPALRRRSPLQQNPNYQRNTWDGKMMAEAQLWSTIAKRGGLKTCCRIPELGSPLYDIPPFEAMPSNGKPIQQMLFLSTASITPGVDTVIGQFTIPIGFDGVINRFTTSFTGSGYVDGSGNIIWRLQIGRRFARDLGNVNTTFGSLQTAFMIPGTNLQRCISGQTVSAIANIPNGSPVSGGNVIAGIFGWIWPRR